MVKMFAPQPHHTCAVEVREHLEQHPHVRGLDAAARHALDLLHVHEALLAALGQVLHQDDALLLGLADEAPRHVVILVVAVGVVHPGDQLEVSTEVTCPHSSPGHHCRQPHIINISHI